MKRHLLIPLKLQAAIALLALSMVFPVVLTVARKEVIAIGGFEKGKKDTHFFSLRNSWVSYSSGCFLKTSSNMHSLSREPFFQYVAKVSVWALGP